MYEFIKKKFIRDYKNVADKNVRLSYGLTAGVCGILSNLLLCALKAVFGIISGSISMVADAVNNLSDAGSSVVTVFGLRCRGKARTKSIRSATPDTNISRRSSSALWCLP